MSRNNFFVTNQYLDKQEVLGHIKRLALERGFRVETEDTMDSNDIDLYLDNPEDEEDLLFFCSMSISSKQEFKDDIFIINDEEYYIYIYTNESSSNIDKEGKYDDLLKELMTIYPNMYEEIGENKFANWGRHNDEE